MKSFAIVFSLLILVVGVASAATHEGDKAAADLPRFSDPSKPIIVESGTAFVIELDSNKTTGYEWQIAYPLDKYAFELVGVEYVKPRGSIPGAEGKENWTFNALSSRNGKLPIAFKYVRAWEKDLQPAKEITFSVTINKGADERRLEHIQKEMDQMRDESLNESLSQ